jgi:cupin superfamily acireductone dioxygenase involved in methionine salvage
MSVLVLRVDDMERVRMFFEQMGLTFVKEKHGKGPEHFAAEHGENVLEIYPSRGYGSNDVVVFVKESNTTPPI